MIETRTLPDPPRYPARRRKGRCFELAARGQLRVDPTWTLVHGRAALVARLPLLIAHAWLEKNGYVYDPTLDEVLPAEEYVDRYKAIVERRYSASEAAQQLLSTENWGPWHLTHDITVVGHPVTSESPEMIARRKRAQELVLKGTGRQRRERKTHP